MRHGNVGNRLSNDAALHQKEMKSRATSTGKACGIRERQEGTYVYVLAFVMNTCNWVSEVTALLVLTLSPR
jgi:hypothetical protein